MKCFIIAMQKEAQPLIEAMRDLTEKTVHGKKVYGGTLFGCPTHIVVCGIGKVNAACGAQYAISELKADELVNIGVAGGLNDSVHIGEIYSIERAVQYDFDLTELNGTAMGTLDECKENYLPLFVDSDFPARRLATGDRFNDSTADYKLLTDTLKADIRDMEGGAIAQVCMHAKIKFSAYKIISDVAKSGSTSEQYFKNLALCFNSLRANLKKIVKL
ncbi:MAG: 5'-methylthioadenosine/S-adenosylhomocysteine nucleosidase [Clostridiales bacterium]|nr:5'-methylthioadenosine/S-adenosylhomocysteine nucleosidase [Clostridiales bacterium]